MSTEAKAKAAILAEIDNTIKMMLANNKALAQLPPDGDAEWTRQVIKITMGVIDLLGERVTSLRQKLYDLETK
jgi:hypothetical protein